MLGYISKIKEVSIKLLSSGAVDAVIGFRKGTTPMTNEPCFITTSDKISSLVWDSNCRINLANYITDRKEKIAIIAKGCDSRNIVTHIIENKIARHQLYIIGIPCTGMIDKGKVEKKISGEILNVVEKKNTIIVETTELSEVVLNKKEIIQENCLCCIYPNPIISDEMIDKNITIQENYIDKYHDIDNIESMDSQEKWDFFDKMFSTCIRCYACKNSCPLCYCPVCFVDEADPQWVGKGQDSNDIKLFHFLRAYHCAGRCTDCGTCEQVCPLEINMRILTRKLMYDCKTEFDWEAGLSLEDRPALDAYNTKDSNKFIK